MAMIDLVVTDAAGLHHEPRLIEEPGEAPSAVAACDVAMSPLRAPSLYWDLKEIHDGEITCVLCLAAADGAEGPP